MIFLYDNLLIFESYNIVENLRLNSNNFLRQLILPDNLSEKSKYFFFRYNLGIAKSNSIKIKFVRAPGLNGHYSECG